MASNINASTSSGVVTTADNSGVLNLQTANTTALTIDTSQNVGIGTTSPVNNVGYTTLTINNATTGGVVEFQNAGTSIAQLYNSSSDFFVSSSATKNIKLVATGAAFISATTNGTERMRIDSAGVVTIGGNTVITTAANTTFTAGFRVTSYSLGNTNGATITPNALNSNYQYATNNGAGTIAAPVADCAIDILLQNTTGAGAITFTGFTVQAGNIGDPLTTTTTGKFIISIRRINSISTYIIKQIDT